MTIDVSWPIDQRASFQDPTDSDRGKQSKRLFHHDFNHSVMGQLTEADSDIAYSWRSDPQQRMKDLEADIRRVEVGWEFTSAGGTSATMPVFLRRYGKEAAHL